MYVCISVCVHVGVCVSGENMLDMALWFTALSLTHTCTHTHLTDCSCIYRWKKGFQELVGLRQHALRWDVRPRGVRGDVWNSKECKRNWIYRRSDWRDHLHHRHHARWKENKSGLILLTAGLPRSLNGSSFVQHNQFMQRVWKHIFLPST